MAQRSPPISPLNPKKGHFDRVLLAARQTTLTTQLPGVCLHSRIPDKSPEVHSLDPNQALKETGTQSNQFKRGRLREKDM